MPRVNDLPTVNVTAGYPTTFETTDEVVVLQSGLAVKGAMSLLPFVQSGTGAVARTVQTKLREFPSSPEDFGATGDGSTDDTTALQAWIDAVPISTGGTDPGWELKLTKDAKYKLTAKLTIGNRRIFVKGGANGIGSGGTWLYQSVVDTDFIDFTTGNSDVFSLDGVNFLGVASGTGRAVVLGRTAQPCYDSRITNCWFASIGGASITGTDMQGCHITNCAFDSGATEGIVLTKGSDNVITTNRFYGMSSNGFSLIEGENNLIGHNHYDLCGAANDTTGAILINRTGTGTRGNTIVGNIFRANKNDIVLNGNSGVYSSNTGVNDTAIIGNTTDRAYRRFLLATDAHQTHVVGNKIATPNQDAASLDAVEIAGTSDQTYLEGNSVSLGGSAPNLPLYGLSLGASTTNTVLGTNSWQGTTGDINVVAGATIATRSAYQVGNWTPVVSFGGGTTGITYALQVGKYVRQGRLVTVYCEVTLSNKGSSTGAASLGGLPFATANGATYELIVGAQITLTGQLLGFTASGGSALALYQLNSGAVGAQLAETEFANNSQINFSFSYQT